MASKRAMRRRSCAGKKRYDDERRARHDAECLSHKESKTIVAYQCRFCGGIHVGHQSYTEWQSDIARRAARWKRAA